MLVLNRTTGDFADHIFRDITEYPRREDVLVLNNTKVFPVQLVGERQPGGGEAELFLVRSAGDGVWDAIARPGRKLREGATVRFGDERRADILDMLGLSLGMYFLLMRAALTRMVKPFAVLR